MVNVIAVARGSVKDEEKERIRKEAKELGAEVLFLEFNSQIGINPMMMALNTTGQKKS